MESDLPKLLDLYQQLHPEQTFHLDQKTEITWQKILSNPNHVILIGFIGQKICSSCHMAIIDNLTHENRPYAVIENVVTDHHYRQKGYATQLLNYASVTAQKENCYKIMLMTSHMDYDTLRFYEQAGFSLRDKLGFVRWLE
jgi:GNAT superfamily N-acetyltransferase